MFYLCTFRVFFSSVEFISLHSLFTLSFHFDVHISYTRELYQRGAYLYTPLLDQLTFFITIISGEGGRGARRGIFVLFGFFFFFPHHLLTTPGEIGLLGREGRMVKHHHYREEWGTTFIGEQTEWDA